MNPDEYNDTYDNWPKLPRVRAQEVNIPPGWMDSLDAVREWCRHTKHDYDKIDVHVHWMENAKRFISIYYEGWVFSILGMEFRVLDASKKEIGSVVLVNRATLRELLSATPQAGLYCTLSR